MNGEEGEEEQSSYYAILNVSKDASEEEVKRAYKHLAQIYHPDKLKQQDAQSGKVAVEAFMRIQEAYEVQKFCILLTLATPGDSWSRTPKPAYT